MKFIVYDLEATCWDGRSSRFLQVNQQYESQMIEIGALMVDGSTFEIESEFCTFIKPTKHPKLSPFCKQLTSIKQTDVDDAPGFKEAYESFVQWMGDPREVVLCSWGRYDHNQFVRECREHELEKPLWTPLNVKEEFSAWNHCHGRSKKGRGLGKAIQMLGLTFDGVAHRGIDDARNVVRIFKHIRNPENMSDLAKDYMRVLHTRSPQPTNYGHLRDEIKRSDLKQWHPRVLNELGRLNYINNLGGGRGFLPMENIK